MPTVSVPQAFALAIQHHQAGRLPDAEALYRQIVAVQPNHAEALHHLGVIARQAGRHDLAVEWIRQSLVAAPNNPTAHFDLGEAWRMTGRLDEAVAAFHRALELQPDYLEALSNLGVALTGQGRLDEAVAAYGRALKLRPDSAEVHYNLGNALRDRGQLDEAIAEFRRALELKPDLATAHNNLGTALKDRGQLDEAITSFRRALQWRPDYALAWYNLGNVLRERGQLDEAIAAFRHVLQFKPDDPEASNNLGGALAEQGRLDEALAAFRGALQFKPDHVEAHSNLGKALVEQGQLDEAIAAFRRALQFGPDSSDAHYNLGMALARRGQLEEAVAAFRHVLRLQPDYPEAHKNLGAALAGQSQLDEAIAAFHHVLQLKPDDSEAHVNLGTVLARKGQLDQAVAAHRRALELKPNFPEAHNNLGAALKSRGELDEAIAAYRRAIEFGPEDAVAHSNLLYALHFHPGYDASKIAGEQHRWDRQLSASVERFFRPHTNDRSPERRLRIGYVSPDFRGHVVGMYVAPLLQHYDHQEFEIYCYSGVVKGDRLTEEFRQRADHWRNTVGIGDEALAAMIRKDGVDILVDLTLHMAGNRLPVFARRPAPVQVSFGGYPASTGLEAIGYRISDSYLVGNSTEGGRRKKERVCLIDNYWCYRPWGVQVTVNALPARESGQVTFGCLNNFSKVNEPVLRLWARVLGEVKDSRLVLVSGVGSHRKRAREILERAGVEAQRVEFVEPCPLQAYFELYHRLDIALDPFPYNGGATSLDALWMGVPVVSLAGEGGVSRVGWSQLSHLGLPELAAFSEDDYVRIATQLAHDLPRLAELRATLRPRMEASPLMDAPRFARNIETAYRTMWQQWCVQES